jgi:hypothetical protein
MVKQAMAAPGRLTAVPNRFIARMTVIAFHK